MTAWRKSAFLGIVLAVGGLTQVARAQDVEVHPETDEERVIADGPGNLSCAAWNKIEHGTPEDTMMITYAWGVYSGAETLCHQKGVVGAISHARTESCLPKISSLGARVFFASTPRK